MESCREGSHIVDQELERAIVHRVGHTAVIVRAGNTAVHVVVISADLIECRVNVSHTGGGALEHLSVHVNGRPEFDNPLCEQIVLMLR